MNTTVTVWPEIHKAKPANKEQLEALLAKISKYAPCPEKVDAQLAVQNAIECLTRLSDKLEMDERMAQMADYMDLKRTQEDARY